MDRKTSFLTVRDGPLVTSVRSYHPCLSSSISHRPHSTLLSVRGRPYPRPCLLPSSTVDGESHVRPTLLYHRWFPVGTRPRLLRGLFPSRVDIVIKTTSGTEDTRDRDLIGCLGPREAVERKGRSSTPCGWSLPDTSSLRNLDVLK